MRQLLCACIPIMLCVCVSYSQDDIRKKKVPHKDDETSLVRIKATPEKAVGKSVILCGTVEISDYYNYAYGEAQDSHYSLKFREIGEIFGDQYGDDAHFYFAKSLRTDSLEIITKANEQKRKKLVRAEVMLVPTKFQSDKQWNMFEVIDFQFFDIASEKWLPWVVKAAKEEEQKKKVAKEEEERAKREEKQKEAAAALAAKNAAKTPKTDEENAASKLKLAKPLLETNKVAGRKRLQEIVDKYPDTPSAQQAKLLLKKNE